MLKKNKDLPILSDEIWHIQGLNHIFLWWEGIFQWARKCELETSAFLLTMFLAKGHICLWAHEGDWQSSPPSIRRSQDLKGSLKIIKPSVQMTETSIQDRLMFVQTPLFFLLGHDSLTNDFTGKPYIHPCHRIFPGRALWNQVNLSLLAALNNFPSLRECSLGTWQQRCFPYYQFRKMGYGEEDCSSFSYNVKCHSGV